MWIDVYVINDDGTHEFRQRVERPVGDVGLHALRVDMAKHLSDSPMQPLPIDRVMLKPFPDEVEQSIGT